MFTEDNEDNEEIDLIPFGVTRYVGHLSVMCARHTSAGFESLLALLPLLPSVRLVELLRLNRNRAFKHFPGFHIPNILGSTAAA